MHMKVSYLDSIIYIPHSITMHTVEHVHILDGLILAISTGWPNWPKLNHGQNIPIYGNGCNPSTCVRQSEPHHLAEVAASFDQ